MEDLKYWVWLSRINKTKIILKLLEEYKTPEEIWRITKEEFIALGLSEKTAENISGIEYRKNLDKYLEYMKKCNIEVVPIHSKYYPKKLRNIYDPPICIYVKGNKNILNNLGIAIVGCRNSTRYGENTAKKFAYNLSKYNINIISGGARGIDTCSHMGSLGANGKTIVVVGTGLDRVYPPENKYLFEEVIKRGGAIVSEYVIGTEPVPYNFPQRNRIISGMAEGVIVVEAKEKSGTLITVDFALEQRKKCICYSRKHR